MVKELTSIQNFLDITTGEVLFSSVWLKKKMEELDLSWTELMEVKQTGLQVWLDREQDW